ncbi:methylcobalamin:coenzyme M methyltransferase [Oxobacter pfennigii]|uniref:Methylcobalamin:coenzyme M methyltransferase n=2 Tax=Oxobacter pfennigii TaxID=36849 RepID=A0A0P8X5R1_9CLOT|nr:methylcobalamin:coenzyme M methyltransferase [Oxobacter pfennigii]
MLTEKENYLKILNGEIPEWIPQYNYGVLSKKVDSPINMAVRPGFLNEHRKPDGGTDIWGVRWVPTYETGNMMLPAPGEFILTDIRKWRDVIKAPDISNIDWEAMAKKDLELLNIDRSKTAIHFGTHFGYFQTVMSFMGFNEGLCAMYEEPEEVKELMNYLADFYLTIAEKLIDLYKPDIVSLTDDTASELQPFFSREMYVDMLLPLYDKHAKFGRDRGLPITMHNCGRCEDVMEDLFNIGVRGWDPAQTINDLVGIKKKFNNKLVIMGGWDGRGRLLAPDVTDEEIYESARKSINTYGPGGGYVFAGQFTGPVDDPVTIRKNAVLLDAVYELGHSFY